MYEEYTTPKVKVHITARHVRNFFLWLFMIITALAALFGLFVLVAESNTEEITNKLDNDCLVVTYKDNHAFEPDRDLSGIYCKEDDEY